MNIGKITIQGLIGTMGETKGIELIDVVSQVKNLGEVDSYNVYLSSEGGVVETGFDIYNYLKSLDKPVHMIGSGIVGSIATVVFMAGGRRSITSGTQFMIHLPWTQALGTSEELLEYSKEIKKTEDKVIAFYVDNYGLTKEAITPLLKNETWLDEVQLKELGIVTSDEAIKIVAVASLKKPKTENKMSAKSENLIEKIFSLLTQQKPEAKMKIVFTADQQELDFFEVEEGVEIAVGDMARLNGDMATGELVIADGRKLIFEEGVLTAIEEVVGDDGADTPDVVEELRLENEQIKADLLALTSTHETLKVENEKNIEILNAIRKVEGDYKAPQQPKVKPNANESKKSKFGMAMANIKKK